MVVKIRLGHGPRVQRKTGKNRHVARAFAALLVPGALSACVLAFWRLASDIGWSGQFAITDGLFSHWQVWFGIAALTQFVAILLNRYGGPNRHVPISEEKSSDTLLNSES
jgi:hypothetical protein